MSAPLTDDLQQPRVKIVGKDHPHRGEYGRWTGRIISVLGERMGEVRLEHCKHGTDGCYVSPGQIRMVNDDDQYL